MDTREGGGGEEEAAISDRRENDSSSYGSTAEAVWSSSILMEQGSYVLALRFPSRQLPQQPNTVLCSNENRFLPSNLTHAGLILKEGTLGESPPQISL